MSVRTITSTLSSVAVLESQLEVSEKGLFGANVKFFKHISFLVAYTLA